MAAKPRSPEVLQQALDAVAKHGTIMGAAKALGVSRATFQHIHMAAERWKENEGRLPVTPTETVSVKGDECEITKTVHERIKSLADLVRLCEIDESEWEVTNYVCNKWDSAGFRRETDGSTRPVVTELYQVKAWLKRRRGMVAAKREIASLIADAKLKIAPRVKIVKASSRPTGLMFEPHIPDLHLGKLAWAKETGWEDYDSGIAERVFEDALEAMMDRAASFRCDSVLYPIGNDFFHSDTKAGTTTAGTPLDNDSRYHKMFGIGRRMQTRAIDKLRTIGQIKVPVIYGNHGTLAEFHLGDSLECWFHNTPGVQIDNAPKMRKYHEHGRVMILMTHGNKSKLEKYPGLMAAEEPGMWGRTVFREAHTGDKHHQRTLELPGCIVRITQALCPPDSWHAENGFIGTQRGAEAFVFSKSEGRVGTVYYTVPDDREGAA